MSWEQQFGALSLFRDAVCVALRILFLFIGCGFATREQGALLSAKVLKPGCADLL